MSPRMVQAAESVSLVARFEDVRFSSNAWDRLIGETTFRPMPTMEICLSGAGGVSGGHGLAFCQALNGC